MKLSQLFFTPSFPFYKSVIFSFRPNKPEGEKAQLPVEKKAEDANLPEGTSRTISVSSMIFTHPATSASSGTDQWLKGRARESAQLIVFQLLMDDLLG